MIYDDSAVDSGGTTGKRQYILTSLSAKNLKIDTILHHNKKYKVYSTHDIIWTMTKILQDEIIIIK